MTAAFEETTVLALHEPSCLTSHDGSIVRGAGGRSTSFAAAALRGAAAAGPNTHVIVTHLHLAPAALAYIARGASLTTMLCGIEAWQPVTRMQCAALSRAMRLIAISNFTRDRFKAANPRFADRDVDVCHLGVEPSASDGVMPAASPAALIVGRMARDERYKGHDLLLDIWREVAAAVPGAALRIVGDGDDRARLEQKAESLGLAGQVTFFGRLDDDALRGVPSAAPRS